MKKEMWVEQVRFREHMEKANILMKEPYTEDEILYISLPIIGFAQEVIEPCTTKLICNKLGKY